MIKNAALSFDTHARTLIDTQSCQNPAIGHAFKFIRAIYGLVGGLAELSSNNLMLDSYFTRGHHGCDWILLHMRRAGRLSIFVATERLNCLRVEVKWYGKSSRTPFAEMIVLFTAHGPEKISCSNT